MKLHRSIAALLLAAAACNGNTPPAPPASSPSSTAPPQPEAALAKIQNVVTGTAFDIDRVRAPGMVTIIEFWAPW